jgi:hypothetical protein
LTPTEHGCPGGHINRDHGPSNRPPAAPPPPCLGRGGGFWGGYHPETKETVDRFRPVDVPNAAMDPDVVGDRSCGGCPVVVHFSALEALLLCGQNFFVHCIPYFSVYQDSVCVCGSDACAHATLLSKAQSAPCFPRRRTDNVQGERLWCVAGAIPWRVTTMGVHRAKGCARRCTARAQCRALGFEINGALGRFFVVCFFEVMIFIAGPQRRRT